MQFGYGANHRPAQERLEVPAARLGWSSSLGHVDGGIFQPDGGEFQPAAEKRRQTQHGIEGADVGDRFNPDCRILVDHDVLDGEARTREEAEVHRTHLNLAAQRTLQRGPNARGKLVSAQVRSPDAGGDQQYDGDAQPPGGPFNRRLHGRLPARRRSYASASSTFATTPGSSTSM